MKAHKSDKIIYCTMNVDRTLKTVNFMSKTDKVSQKSVPGTSKQENSFSEHF